MTTLERLKAAGDPPRLVKEFVSDVRAVDGADQQYRLIITTERPDRERDTIAAGGWKLENYLRNPVVQWAHDYSLPPIAVARSVEVVDGGLASVADFGETSKVYPFAATVEGLMRVGALRAASVGFRALQWVFNEERRGVDFIEQELLEYSIVPVPANAECLVEARSAGIDVEPLREWATKTLERLGVGQQVVTLSPELADALKIVQEVAPGLRRAYSFPAEQKKVPSDVSDKKAPKDEAWSRPALSDFTSEQWGDISAAERRRIAGHFAWSASWPPDSFGDLKLPHHRASDGAVVFRGVVAAAGRLNQTEGADVEAIKRHLARHYHAFDENAPWESGGRAETRAPSGDEHDGDEPGETERMHDAVEHFARAHAHMGHSAAALARAAHAAHGAGEHGHAEMIHDVHNKLMNVASAAGDCMQSMGGGKSSVDTASGGGEPIETTRSGSADGIVDVSADTEFDVEKVDDEFDVESVRADEIDATNDEIAEALREVLTAAANGAAEKAIARARGRVD